MRLKARPILTNTEINPAVFMCTLTDGHSEEAGHVLQFNSDIGIMDREEAFPPSPKH